MAIHYSLRKHALTDRDGDHVAQVHAAQKLMPEDIARLIHDRGSSLTLADINGVMLLLADVCTDAVASGAFVVLDRLVELRPAVKGMFDGPDDTFDRSRHTIGANAVPTVAFKNAVAERGAVEKRESATLHPFIATVVDIATGRRDAVLTSNNIAEISGYRLKFDAARRDEGIFFVTADGSGSTRVPFVQHNKPRKLVFLTPPGLAAAPYHLEVRARSKHSTALRTGRFPIPLAYT